MVFVYGKDYTGLVTEDTKITKIFPVFCRSHNLTEKNVAKTDHIKTLQKVLQQKCREYFLKVQKRSTQFAWRYLKAGKDEQKMAGEEDNRRTFEQRSQVTKIRKDVNLTDSYEQRIAKAQNRW